MAKSFSQFNYDDAANLVGTKISVGDGTFTLPALANQRRPLTALTATQFYNGDHWQNSRGFIGQIPPKSLPGSSSITADIRAAFVSENVIKEVVKTHTGGILGREPIWSFLQAEGETDRSNKESFENVTGETLTKWWNDRQALKDLQKAVTIALCEGRVVRRIFFPRSLNGTIPRQTEISKALDFIYFETVTADTAGVFTDPATQQDIGIFLYDETDIDGNVTAHCAELSFLEPDGRTRCKIVRDKGGTTVLPPYDLGGHLLIYQIDRDALISDQVQSSQRSLNLAHTMMMRNINMAGNRERNVINAQPPINVKGIDTNKANDRSPGTFKTGSGAVNFLMGYPIYDPVTGAIIGYTNPNVTITDPVPVITFRDTIDQEKEAIYSQCHERHVMIVDKADTSGRAREIARREFERSLKETKTVMDANGRWQLEVTLRLAAQVTGQTSLYSSLRADFNCLIDAGDPDPEQQKTAILLRQPGGPKNQPLISDETARNMCGVEDAAAELAKIEQESKLPEAKLPDTGVKPIPGQQTPKVTQPPDSQAVN